MLIKLLKKIVIIPIIVIPLRSFDKFEYCNAFECLLTTTNTPYKRGISMKKIIKII